MAKTRRSKASERAEPLNLQPELEAGFDPQLDEHERIETAADLRSIELPLADPPATSYLAQETGHLDARLNTPAQRAGLRRLHAGLVAAGAQLAGGKPVVSKADVLRYLFEQLGS
ncbi:MAG: hypothetical protein KY476_10850 [Planctomycetes bacterium]|nr:hypothetical protein [Planctomycetota bacterium]